MILVNNPGSWSHVYGPLAHAEWHGWTPTDLIFPFFLFIVGVSMVFSFGRRRESAAKAQLIRSVVRRAFVLFLLGLLLAAFPEFRLTELRWAGVLQRIALVYLAASAIVLGLSRRAQIALTAALLLGYWALMVLLPVPGRGAGILTPDANVAAWLDGFLVPGRMLHGTWDPEGLVSTLPAIVTTMLGVFTAYWIRSQRPRSERAAGMFAVGWLAILAGLAWDLFFPINKNLWTSSYVLFTAGAALEGLALCFWLIDIQGWRRWAQPLVVFGVNAITVYVLSGLLARLLTWIEVPSPEGTVPLQQWLFDNLLASWLQPMHASLAFALLYVALWWAAMAMLYRRRIFIKV